MIVSLIAGDWSNDGHGRTKQFQYNVNKSRWELIDAHTAGRKIIGIDLESSFRDCDSIKNETRRVILALKEYGYDYGDLDEYSDPFYPEEYADLWMAIAKIGDSSIEYSSLQAAEISIGGYGLFQ
jgi:hypothetical protein